MDENQTKSFARELMCVSQATCLATADSQGRPQIRAMLNLRNQTQFPKLAPLFDEHEDDLLVYFTTNTSSAKVAHIKSNPAVAAYYCEPSAFHGVMLSGDIEIVDDAKLRQLLWQDGWEIYYPSGPNDPDHTVLRLRPSVVSGWCKAGKFHLDLA